MLSKVFTTNKGQMIMPSPNYILHSTQQQLYCQTHCSNICKKTPAAAPPLHSAEGQCSEIGAFTAFQQWSFVLKATLLCACCLDFWLDKK